MTKNQWERVKTIIESLKPLTPEERQSSLRVLRGGGEDPAIVSFVETWTNDPLSAHVSPLPPELKHWALEDINEEDIAAELQDMRQGGGMELSEFIHELEEVVERGERSL